MKYPQLFSEEVQAENRSGKRPLSFPALKDRRPRGKITGPAVILAPGGMAEKGAVRTRTAYLSSFSGHADYGQICEWLNKARRIGRIFIIHGQPGSARGLAGYIRDLTPFEATVPAFLEKIYLDTALPEEKVTETPPDILEEAAAADPARYR